MPSTSDKLRVYITVDTETSMGGAWRNPEYSPVSVDRMIYGKNGSQYYGIPLMMDILEEFGFRATFFVEVFCAHLLGFPELEGVFRCLRERGHDAQLHLHPVFRFYHDFKNGGERREKDLMFQLPPDEQMAMVREGVDLFRRLSGRAPRAFRAGCYGASELTLGALRENGIEIDSSYNMCYLDRTCGFQFRPLNAPRAMEGLIEFPVSNFRLPSGGYKPLEISAVSVDEMLATLRRFREIGYRDMVLVFHSFSLMKASGPRFENSRPDHLVIRRFRKLCRALADMKQDVEVDVLGNVDLSRPLPADPGIVPSVGWIRPVLRQFVQGINRIPGFEM